MKIKTSVALGEETLHLMNYLVRTGKFRNKSHIMEYSIKKMTEEVFY